MEITDKPIFDIEFDRGDPFTIYPENVAHNIKRLVDDQPFCVLCTQGDTQPYGSLIAYATTEDLKYSYFATSIESRKFRLLSECDRAALLIDSRCRHPDDLMKVEALTVTGITRHLQASDEYQTGVEKLMRRHKYLKDFIQDETTALFCFDVFRYFYVTRFQEVRQWIP